MLQSVTGVYGVMVIFLFGEGYRDVAMGGGLQRALKETGYLDPNQ